MISYIRHILRFSGRYKIRLLLAALPLFLKAMMSQMMVFFSYIIIIKLLDRSYAPSDSLKIASAVIAALALEALFQFLSDKLQSSAGFIVMAEKRKALGEHLRKMPMGYFSEGNVGNISTVLATDMTYLEEHGISIAAKLVSEMSLLIVNAVFLTVIEYRLGMMYIFIAAAVLLLSKGMLKTANLEADVRQEQNSRLAGAVIEFVTGIGVIKSFPAASFAAGSVEKAFADSAENNIHFEKKYSPWTLLLGCICAVGTAAVFALGYYLRTTGGLDENYFLGMCLFCVHIFASVRSLYGQSANMALAESSLNRIDALFAENELPDTGHTHLTKNGSPEIEFRNVTFAYGEKDVLHDMSFSLNQGELTALVGPSGGGKSTVVNLIARLCDIKSGEIKVRGTDIRDIPIGELMNEISMVFQRVYLFQDTVYQNIAMGRPDAAKEEVIEAAKKARCHDFIMKLPDGYDTILGEGGASLSGGERQRISIARCILKDAPIILLDEATASVDVDNEWYIQQAISELCRNKTVVVIAHRLYTIQDAEQILVIQNGRIEEQGTYHDLMQKGGVFAAMSSAG